MTAYALTDSRTMLRRNLRRMRRNPGLTLFVAGIPIVILLLFVYVFGGTLGAGLPSVTGTDRGAYADYLAPTAALCLAAAVGPAGSRERRWVRPLTVAVPGLCALIAADKARPSFLVSHRLPLDQAPDAYRHFDQREDGWTKVILKPAA